MRLSEDGERHLPHARATLAAVEGGELALAQGRGEIGGLLRLSVRSDLGHNVLLPWLDAFQSMHPGISLHLRSHILRNCGSTIASIFMLHHLFF
jgi:DNA-binding transcriptional LysR family regulator